MEKLCVRSQAWRGGEVEALGWKESELGRPAATVPGTPCHTLLRGGVRLRRTQHLSSFLRFDRERTV